MGLARGLGRAGWIGLSFCAVACATQVGPPDVGVSSQSRSVSDCPAGYNLIQGNSSNNTLIGTAGNDCILGLGGNDVIWGRGGNDYIAGGNGDDQIHGEGGADQLFGE